MKKYKKEMHMKSDQAAHGAVGLCLLVGKPPMAPLAYVCPSGEPPVAPLAYVCPSGEPPVAAQDGKAAPGNRI
jgi:hypothetical protein